MIRKPETVVFWWGRLPHWEVVDGRYFVTLHLAGAIPPKGQERIRAMAAELRRPACDDGSKRLAVQRRVFAEMEAWLDRAAEVRYREDPRVAESVMEAAAFRDGRDWRMFEIPGSRATRGG
ncbi:MAG: hypothetical protein HUU20_22635 [Pirellulales bacterium]|nr:hypothetical protein [Pirellulales bacterium]